MAPTSITSSMEAQTGSVYSNTTHQTPGLSAALDLQVAPNTPNHPSLTQTELTTSPNIVTNGYQHTNGFGGQNSEPTMNESATHYETIHQTTNRSNQHSASWTPEYFASNGLDIQPGTYAPEIIIEDEQNGDPLQVTPLIAPPQQAVAENHANQDPNTTAHSLLTQTWSQTYSPSERLRLGLPRYASDEERRRAAERAAAHYHSADCT